VYGWIWRHLPYGRPGKFIGTGLIIVALVAALWFWIFPAVEPLLPFDDVQVGTEDQLDTVTDTPTGPPATVAPTHR
jgi:hypothetical protein